MTIAEVEPASNGASATRGTTMMRPYDLLGGKQILNKVVTNALDAHDLIVHGFPLRALLHLVDEVAVLSTGDVLQESVGITSQTLRRRMSGSNETALSREQSDKAWRLAEIVALATDLLGSQEAAEGWLLEPAIGLDNRKPIDLLCTSAGADAVRNYMTQMAYGVYV